MLGIRIFMRDHRHLIAVLIMLVTMLINQGCGFVRPDPISLYPDDPAFDPNEAALINLLPMRPGYTQPVSGWQSVEVVPQDSRADRGSQISPKTWIVLVPPGGYTFSINHPERERETLNTVVDGVALRITEAVGVEISAVLEAGKHYRIVYVDKPGDADFELWEVTKSQARSYAFQPTVEPINIFHASDPRER